jgi:hypothetical protein
MACIMGRVMKREGLDGWARLSASVLQHAYIECSNLYNKRGKKRINKNEYESLSYEINNVRKFLEDTNNEFYAYLESVGHEFDINTIRNTLDSYEGGEECIKFMGRAPGRKNSEKYYP